MQQCLIDGDATAFQVLQFAIGPLGVLVVALYPETSQYNACMDCNRGRSGFFRNQIV